jgi:outer membrane protein
VGFAVYVLYDRHNSKKGYVINQKIFEGFSGTNELEQKLNKIKIVNKRKLDSLFVVVESEKNNKGLAVMYQDLLRSSQLQEQDLSAKYTSEIWRHINDGIADFGKQEGYEFIFGASGNGGIMYANDVNDITEDIVSYLNARYGKAVNE